MVRDDGRADDAPHRGITLRSDVKMPIQIRDPKLIRPTTLGLSSHLAT